MSDLMLHGVLNMPLPDDPAEMDLLTWVQFRDRARQASEHIKDMDAEMERLREALAPFDDAYRLASDLCKSQTLGDWEALAKYHTAAGAYRGACFALAAKERDT